MVTITRHVFINIFQTEHFSAVKFAIGYEKNMCFLVIAKSPEVWKKVEKIGLGFFKITGPLWAFRINHDKDILQYHTVLKLYENTTSQTSYFLNNVSSAASHGKGI